MMFRCGLYPIASLETGKLDQEIVVESNLALAHADRIRAQFAGKSDDEIMRESRLDRPRSERIRKQLATQ